ncbi:MAG: 4-hydroxythreonine-4-phosphate dehydrogenase PdxA [Bacteroidia bacterium]|nr:4-hydroxythreonine-4-phosphate dehydrogenase PdxA [Bacteroidia bacterium]
MGKIKIGITIGDVNGVGLEVILKTIADERILKQISPLIYGSSKIVSYHKNIIGLQDLHFKSIGSAKDAYRDRINIVNCWNDNVTITLGKPSEESGKFAKMALEKSVEDLTNGDIDALVTGPIHKEAMQMAGFEYVGHTEMLTEASGNSESLMFMVSEDVRIGLVTNHIPISDISKNISKENILKKLQIMNDSLKMDFGITKPMIAVLGLNPHAGDGGTIGKEDEEIIRPAVVEGKKNGMMVFGPYSADGFFGSTQYKKFDGILAMYHDQGLIPFKSLTFGSGVNFTAGLKIIRTSPDHGTAYDIAGQNIADYSSFRNAVYLAIDINHNRKNYKEMHANRLKKKSAHISKPEG